MKVLFINASKQWEGRMYREYPYGLGILATLAHQAGHKVSILDMAVDDRTPQMEVTTFHPDVILVSFLSPSVQVAAEVIRQLRKEVAIPIVAGGIHSTLYPESVLEYGTDIVMRGEGELMLLPLLDALGLPPGPKREQALNAIPNILYRRVAGSTIRTGVQTCSVDLDALPVMDRSLFDLRLYSHHTILTSRCCPYKCRFCCSWAPGGAVGRIMSPKRILLELRWLVEHYGSLTLYWGDEIFFWSKRERLDFCRVLKDCQLPIQFIIQLRADLIDEELIQALQEAGCVKVCIGAESGSDRLLRVANKCVTAAQIEHAIQVCVRAGMACKTWWMVGLPGGDKEDQLMALDIIERSRPNEVAVHQFVPLPGSEFWDKAGEYGIHLPDEASFENLNYYSNPTVLSYDYISGQELYDILKTYERRLLTMGYIPTDLADDTCTYVFTTPFQKTTFHI